MKAGKGESVRARAILKSLVSLDDLESILRLRFTIPNVAGEWTEGQVFFSMNILPIITFIYIAVQVRPLYFTEMNKMQPGLKPIHKRSVLLFLDRVYGIENQDMFFRLLEQSFLPDLRAATMLDQV